MKFSPSLLFILFIFLFGSNLSYGQLNVKSGLTVGYINPTNTNTVLEKFNREHAYLNKKFRSLNLIYGLTLGLRYRWEFVDLELSYHIKMRKVRAKGKYEDSTKNFSREVLLGINSISLGLGFHYEGFGFGGSMDLSKLIISGRNDSSKRKDKYPLVNEPFMGNHFYLSYELNGNNTLSLSIRPYIQIPWEKFNINPLHAPLEQNVAPTNTPDDFTNYGLMIIFYNGEKN